MATTSSLTNEQNAIGAQVQAQGGNVQIGNIQVNTNNNRQEDINDDEFNMPQLIDTFHGREEEFKKLDRLFFTKNKSKVLIHGLPGYGKTELTKQYAQQCLEKSKIKHIFWIKAENEGELTKLSKKLKNNYKKYEDCRCLYIFDNALNRRTICNYEPSNTKHKMIITSHTKNWGHGVVPLKLNQLTLKPVLKIFRTILEDNYKKEDRSLYIELAQTVDNVPLGIQIVAGYLRQRINYLGDSFRLADCVEEMKQSKQKIINGTFTKDNPNPYKNSIYGALIVSLHKIKEEDDIEKIELALHIIYVSAFLSPERILIYSLLQIPSIRKLIGTKNIEMKLKSAIGLLINLSFVNYGNSDAYIKIHRLTQSFLIYYLSLSSVQNMECYHSACIFAMFCFNESVLSYADTNTICECVEFLKKVFQNMDKNTTKELIYRYNLFYYAAKWNRLEILEVMLPHADIKINGHKVLLSVAKAWNIEAIELLIKSGVDVNHKDSENKTPIDALLSTFTSLDNYINDKMHDIILSTVALLLQYGALINVNILNKELEFSLLSSAVERNKLELLELFFQQGINVNIRGGKLNSTVLHIATSLSNLKTIQYLISRGADTNALDLDKETPSFKFVQYGIHKNHNIDKQKLREILDLLNCKEHAQKTNIRSHSLIDLAVLEMHENLITLLIQTYDCHVNKQNNFGNTPLHQLIASLDEESPKEEVIRTVRLLIDCGASLNIENRLQHTPLQMLQWRSKRNNLNFKYLVPLLTSNDDEIRNNCFGGCNILLL